jgi:cell division protein FtsI (penicillin-binding protein 3)
VVSSLTSAQMRHMMEGVVLFGTGRKSILDGYTSAGKTGTAQKIDPKTRAYSKTDYVGSFAGFAPVNNPALSVVVIIDSAKGLHQGGQVAAPVFKRIAQQVLAYMNVPHDAEIKNDPRRKVLLASVKDSDLDDSSPDHLGEALDVQQEATATTSASSKPTPVIAQPSGRSAEAVPAKYPGMKSVQGQTETAANQESSPLWAASEPQPAHENGMVVLSVESGAVVPSFIGKPLRSAVESAQQSGFELNVIGSGIAREQSPAPGTHLPSGSKIAVRFSR